MQKTCKNGSNVNNNLYYISVIQERISAVENYQQPSFVKNRITVLYC